MLRIDIKTFKEISIEELYKILQLRIEVFSVEQNCVYQDLDGKDQKALHVVGTKNDEVVAYARIFKAGDYFKEASIGRVVVASDQRTYGYGHAILKFTIEMIEKRLNQTTIKLSAQTYLQKFYESHGFLKTGEEYLEDGIPHIAMIKN